MDHDPLTGLLNMNGFRKRVEELLREYPDTPYFLSYNNIRDFKFINDSLGRESGDKLLQFWAEKSLENLSDKEAIGRIEADHFAVLRHIAGEERMREDEKNVFEPVHNFFIDQGKENRVQICSGIYVLTPKDFRDIDVDHMMDLARVAEKRIRISRKGDYEFYNPDQWKKGKRIAEIVNYLPAAIDAGDIQVWYQPQMDYETGKIIGAEALCRWDHTKLGWLYPFDFISTLEEAGLIFDLDSFVWETVCKDLHRWNESGNRRSVSVNVSRDDIREDRDISEHFRNLIQKYNLAPDQLHIEITETAYVENPEILISTTEKLRSIGFQVEMDDFGSGYSSLHMLKEVPVDRIKLDLHFLTASGDPEKSRTIVSCMVQMVHLLGMEMIAEGVETVEQAEFLKDKGCSEMQGYYFYKPLPVQEFVQIFSDES
jgi:EAL domain-containing protein (putative c-di-GMP-specific phosphodiesterase class I)/GGDEF domain-containing protein